MKPQSPNRLALSLWWNEVSGNFPGLSDREIWKERLFSLGALLATVLLAFLMLLSIFALILSISAVRHWLQGTPLWFDPTAPAFVLGELSALNHNLDAHPVGWGIVLAVFGLGGAGYLGWYFLEKMGEPGWKWDAGVALAILAACMGAGWVGLVVLLGLCLAVSAILAGMVYLFFRTLVFLPATLRRRRDALLAANPKAVAAMEKARLASTLAASNPAPSRSRL
jgi:hypothetical protein